MNQVRQPKGRPTGGEFAAHNRADGEVSLGRSSVVGRANPAVKVRGDGSPLADDDWQAIAQAKVIAEMVRKREAAERREQTKVTVRERIAQGATDEELLADGTVSTRIVKEVRREARPAQTQEELRGHDFYPDNFHDLPPLYATDETPVYDKQVVAKYFGPAGDWWIVEVDHETGEAFGYAQLASMPDMAEWGYIDLPELERLRVGPFVGVERDLHFEPKRFGDVAPRRR